MQNTSSTPLREILSKRDTFSKKHSHPNGRVCFLLEGEIRMCIEHAGGMFIVQCAHWTIPLSDFPVPRKGKSDASESLHLRQSDNPVDDSRQDCRFVFLILKSSVFIQRSFDFAALRSG